MTAETKDFFRNIASFYVCVYLASHLIREILSGLYQYSVCADDIYIATRYTLSGVKKNLVFMKLVCYLDKTNSDSHFLVWKLKGTNIKITLFPYSEYAKDKKITRYFQSIPRRMVCSTTASWRWRCTTLFWNEDSWSCCRILWNLNRDMIINVNGNFSNWFFK